MADISFSHRFANHWLQAPTAVREALVQELDDIANLLLPKTDPTTFEFQIEDLDAYIDAQMPHSSAHSIPNVTNEQLEGSTIEGLETLAKDAHQALDDSITASEAKTAQTTINQAQIETQPSDLSGTSKPEMELEQINALKKELHSRVEDYLSEQLFLMSEDIRGWLDEEIEKRLKS